MIAISLLISLTLALFGIIVTTQDQFIDSIGCNSKYKEFQNLFNSIDTYLFEVDMHLCSKNCPCYIYNTKGYLNNTAISKEYFSWTKSDYKTGAISYADCSDQVKNDVMNYYNTNKNSSSFNLNQADFIQFFKTIEISFKCTGLCKTSYINRNTNKEEIMAKYLFSDLSM